MYTLKKYFVNRGGPIKSTGSGTLSLPPLNGA